MRLKRIRDIGLLTITQGYYEIINPETREIGRNYFTLPSSIIDGSSTDGTSLSQYSLRVWTAF